MIPSAANSDYPKFVADQVLTSDNLNDLFGYLDEQGRMTRTNLIGMGIVCGLQVKTAADGSSITITKGVGVTSSGYLVSVPEVTYTKRTSEVFDAVKCEYYNKFVDIGTKLQKFDLWELKQEAESNGTTALTKPFLTAGEKIVLIFVELLEENNKNCDPDSCDDKGINVTVNFRPLLIEKAHVAGLVSGTGGGTDPWLTLPEITMKRFDVEATPIYECLNIFDAYRKILNNTFLAGTQTALSQAYNTLSPILADEFPSNPFSTLAADFEFLNDGSISTSQLIAIQYYYDLFSDILLAYSEFRKKGIEFIGVCCPDDIFPRHLLLDLAIPDATKDTSSYRHYFIPSPLFHEQQKTVSELKVLFKKLVLLIQKFSIPSMAVLGGNKKVDANIRITPSVLANIPLSAKSIPYYYPIQNATDTLLKNWSPGRLMQKNTNRNLSYHAINYNAVHDDIRNPLAYDLEPYNFLRVEGHIGKPWRHVVKNILDIRNRNRLPFELVALSADITAITAFIKELGKLLTQGNTNSQSTLEALTGSSCHFNDLELLYGSITSELSIKLSNEMKFFYDLKRDAKRPPLGAPNSNIPQVPLLVKTDATYRFTTNSIGHEFELFYQTVKNLPFIPIQVFFQQFGQAGNTDVIDFLFKALLYYIEVLFETITTGLSNFNFFNFNFRYFTLIYVVRFIKLLNRFFPEQFPLSEEENDHLDGILAIAAEGRMFKLYMEFLKRILQVKIMQQAGYYAMCHPGIQHKAGVPMGGTFIVVYHEAEVAEVIVVTENVTFTNATEIAVAQNKAMAATGAGDESAGETFSAQQHVHQMAGEIEERLMMTKDRMETNLQQFFKLDTGKAGRKEKAQGPAQDRAQALAAAPPTENKKAAASNEAAAAETSEQRIANYLLSAAKYLKNREDSDLDEAIEDINDGVVIADFYLPYLCCSDCPPMQFTIAGEGEKENLPPVARPGDNVSIQLPDNSVLLDGSTSSDPDGSIKTYLWEKDSGPNVTIETPAENKTIVSKLEEGVYTFKLTVTDDDGASDSAIVTVTVLPKPNEAPTANASASPSTVVLQGTSAPTASSTLDGTASVDPDGSIVSFEWSLPAGTTGATMQTPTQNKTMVIFTKPGLYVFTLTVKDDKGASGTAEVSVTVTEAPNQPPVAKAAANPSTVVMSPNGTGQSQLNSSGSIDPDGNPITFKWSLPAGTTGATLQTPNAPTTNIIFSAPGSYTVTLTVTDSKGAVGTATVLITVTLPPNQPPVAVATANPTTLVLPAGTTAPGISQLDGSTSSDPDGSIVSFLWSLPAGTTGASISSPTANKTSAQFTAPGTYVFTLTVKDNKGDTDTANVTVVVSQQAPQKTCGALSAVVTDFRSLPTADSSINFNTFTRLYSFYQEIDGFYGRMQSGNIPNQTVANQVAFFNSEKVELRMPVWIQGLENLIKESFDMRVLCLRMLNVHAQLTYYISCIQKDDVNKAQVQMNNSLVAILNVLKAIEPLLPNFPANQRNILKTLRSLTVAERNRVKNNNEESVKPKYVEWLQTIIDLLINMNV